LITAAARPTTEEWRARGASFEWRGQRIFFRAEGRGEPLLLIHGFPTASWDWCALWPALVERYRVLTLDMIGFGFSAKPRHFGYSILAQADLFGAFLARESVTRYRLLAHDYGVTVTQELLARQDEDASAPRIAGVCLLNGGLFPETHRALPMQRLLASPLGPLLARLTSDRTFAATMHRIWGTHPPDAADLRAMWRLVTHDRGLLVMPELIGYMAERRRRRERWVGALTSARAPLRLIDGLEDPISGAHMVARYRELVREPDVVELAGVGHYPQLEAPEAVLSAVIDFFTRAPKARD
jgi:pimeloyl-ACP methyl ester carboxylesterase